MPDSLDTDALFVLVAVIILAEVEEMVVVVEHDADFESSNYYKNS